MILPLNAVNSSMSEHLRKGHSGDWCCGVEHQEEESVKFYLRTGRINMNIRQVVAENAGF